ncbi:MAG: ATP:cob(I)alamin adenosyltransferase, partial [Duncaniella sp.]|nr:ATP:cob(I)alamin adenosyltransferase [Duncaniella sp.]
RTLFSIGAYLATPSTTLPSDNSDPQSEPAPISPDLLTDLEHQIDLLDSSIPPLKLFVLPGGSVGAAHAHVARTVCRRAERDILTLADTGAYIHPIVLTYVNRLSDYLFALARYINHFTGTPELTWRP